MLLAGLEGVLALKEADNDDHDNDDASLKQLKLIGTVLEKRARDFFKLAATCLNITGSLTRFGGLKVSSG